MSAVIVILNYNDAERTIHLAKSICGYSCIEKVILVDNASSDDSVEVMQTYIKENSNLVPIQKIIIASSPINGGYAKGNNLGIRYAIEKYNPNYLFVANPDIMVGDKTLEKIIEALRLNKDYGVIAPLVRQGYNVWNLPNFMGIIESLFLVWFNLDKRHIKKQIEKKTESLCEVGVVEGSLFGISKEAYLQINGLDEGTFLYCEENILASRLRDKGYKVGVLSKEYYDHFHSVSIKKHYKSKAGAFHNFYDSFKYYNKKYLKVTSFQKGIFEIMYRIAYLERCVYDLIKR